jgi:hypothetical protein
MFSTKSHRIRFFSKSEINSEIDSEINLLNYKIHMK